MNRFGFASIALAGLLVASAAAAQTANSSPTAPAPGGMAGTPPSSSTTGPSGGAAMRKGDQAGPETEVERKEQARQDKVMSICKGC